MRYMQDDFQLQCGILFGDNGIPSDLSHSLLRRNSRMEMNAVEKTFNITDRKKNGTAALMLKYENSV